MERRELRRAARGEPAGVLGIMKFRNRANAGAWQGNQVTAALAMPAGIEERRRHSACARTLERILFGENSQARAVATR